jgi:hypothetical protein
MARKKKLSKFSEGLSISQLNDNGTVVSSLQRANHKAANGESEDAGRVGKSRFGGSRSVQAIGPPSGRSLRTPVTELLIGDSEDG